MRSFIGFILSTIITNILVAQAPQLTPRVIPATGELYTYKWIKNPTLIDTSMVGENLLWDFSRLKDTASYYEEVHREPIPSQSDAFDDIYSVDSNSIKEDLTIWVNYLDSSGFYRIGAFEKPSAPESEIPYIYDDTMVVFRFPITYGTLIKDKYEFIKNGRRHYKNQFVLVTIHYDAFGTLILPNDDTCHHAMRIRREERIFNLVNEAPKLIGTKLYFYWYDAYKSNYFLKVNYANGQPMSAWYQKKKGLIKKKRNYD